MSAPAALLESIRDRARQDPEAAYRAAGYSGALRRTGHNLVGLCPFHDERTGSFAITAEGEHAGCFKCFGCDAGGDIFKFFALRNGTDFPATVAGLQLALGIARPETRKPAREVGRTVYEVRDATGALIASHVRVDRADGDKAMWWERDGQKNLNGLKLPDLPLYGADRLPDDGTPVVLTEGEKACEALIARGVLACGTVTGAPSTPSDETLRLVVDRPVILWPDADEPGAAHMRRIGNRLVALGCPSVRVVDWPEAPEKGDAADFTGDLIALLADAADYQPGEVPDDEDETAGKRKPRCAPARGDDLTEFELTLLQDLTDSGNAELLAHFHGDDLRFDHARRRWLVWSGHWWAEDADGEPPRLVRECARWRADHASTLPDDKSKRAFGWAISSRHASRVTAALSMAESTRPFADTGEGWDGDPWLVGVANGVIDLRTGELRDGRREDRITRALPWAFDPDATCPRWCRFLAEVFGGDEALIEHVRRAVGYSLTGDQSEACWWLLHGTGANGKSVFLSTLLHLFGDLGWSTGFATFAARPATGGHQEDLANLEGRRLVTASETAEGTKLAEGRIKALSGGDRITASAKYAHERTFDPHLHLWLAVNHLPTVTDDSFAFWRRVRFLPFLQRFRPAEDCEPGDLPDDPRLAEKLRDEVPGILAWAVAGCRAWREGGLTKPPAVVAAVEAYRIAEDPLGAFLEDLTTADPDAFTTTGDLFAAYTWWAEREGIPVRARLSHTAFARRIGERYTRTRRIIDGQRLRGFEGIGLQTG